MHTLRSTLDELKLSALEQDTAAFDPSGTGGRHAGAEDSVVQPGTSSNDEESGLRGSEVESLTTRLSELTWDDLPEQMKQGEGSSAEPRVEQKEDLLLEMFPSMDAYTVKHTLSKANGILPRAMDTLLNLSFLTESDVGEGGSLVPKGIDGFAAGTSNARGRRRWGRRKDRSAASTRSNSATSSGGEGSTSSSNKWLVAAKDVDFICARTDLSQETVRSKYHASGASLPATIRTLALAEVLKLPQSPLESGTELQISELAQGFPDLGLSELAGILTISRRNTSAAHELAYAMTRSPTQENRLGGIQILAHHSPVDLLTEAEPPSPTSSSSWMKMEHSSTRSLALASHRQGQVALSQASAAFRRAKSDHLMGGAAAYYSDVGREHIEASKKLQAAAANSFVMQQSTPTMLDLHGTTVADATRIARIKVAEWWEGLGDAKYRSGGGGPARAGYRIVTGVGRHSKDGSSRLGPAVSKMLVREGWRIEICQGELIVTGKSRR